MGKKRFRGEETPPNTAQKGRTHAGPSTWCRAGGAQDALTTLSCESGGTGGGPCHQEPHMPLYHSRTFLPQVKKDPIPTRLTTKKIQVWASGTAGFKVQTTSVGSSQPSVGLA